MANEPPTSEIIPGISPSQIQAIIIVNTGTINTKLPVREADIFAIDVYFSLFSFFKFLNELWYSTKKNVLGLDYIALKW